jgi:hypothetical protein
MKRFRYLITIEGGSWSEADKLIAELQGTKRGETTIVEFCADNRKDCEDWKEELHDWLRSFTAKPPRNATQREKNIYRHACALLKELEA